MIVHKDFIGVVCIDETDDESDGVCESVSPASCDDERGICLRTPMLASSTLLVRNGPSRYFACYVVLCCTSVACRDPSLWK